MPPKRKRGKDASEAAGEGALRWSQRRNATGPNRASDFEGKPTSKGSEASESDQSTQNPPEDPAGESQHLDDLGEELESAILDILRSRDPGKTC